MQHSRAQRWSKTRQAEDLQGHFEGIFLIRDINHTANPISGDFSFGAAGFYIEGGAILHPVKGIAIAGNLLDLFKSVDAVADDLRFFGTVGSPSLRVSELDISGK